MWLVRGSAEEQMMREMPELDHTQAKDFGCYSEMGSHWLILSR